MKEPFEVSQIARQGNVVNEWTAHFDNMGDLKKCGRKWSNQYGGCKVIIMRERDHKTWRFQG